MMNLVKLLFVLILLFGGCGSDSSHFDVRQDSTMDAGLVELGVDVVVNDADIDAKADIDASEYAAD